jgi:hypothetical protein
MIFCARQLVEKSREHNTKTYTLFVDLKKAHDSVPHQASRAGSLEVWHTSCCDEGMKAEVTVDGSVTPEIKIENGQFLFDQ